MSASYLVVVGGLPSSGKSTIADMLQSQLQVPLIAKDAIKETLFDVLGASERSWSKKLSEASYAVMFAHAKSLLAAGGACIVEGNFRWHEQQRRFEELSAFGAQVVQVNCVAQPDILIARFRERALRRHSGHVDLESAAELEQEMRQSPQTPLPIAGEIFVCDTSADWRAAMSVTVDAIAKLLQEAV